MKLGKLIELLQEQLDKSGPNVEVGMIVEPEYDQAFLDGLKDSLDKNAEGKAKYQYETEVDSFAYSERQNSIFFLPKDF